MVKLKRYKHRNDHLKIVGTSGKQGGVVIEARYTGIFNSFRS